MTNWVGGAGCVVVVGVHVAGLLHDQVRARRAVAGPVDRRAVRARRVERQDHLRRRCGRRAARAASRSRSARSASSAGPLLVGQQRGDDRHRARRVLHPDDRAVVLLVDLDRGVRARRRGAADQQRDVEALALHLGGEVDHLVQRRRDQPGQPDDVGVVLLGGVEDLLRRHHHAEVDDVVVVALQHDADDVLADVVDVALDRRHDDRAVAAPGVLGRLARPR